MTRSQRDATAGMVGAGLWRHAAVGVSREVLGFTENVSDSVCTDETSQLEMSALKE